MENLFEYGLIGLFLASFLAATVIPLSSEALFGLLIIADYNLYSVIFVASFGNWIGGITTYYIGFLGKWDWIEKYLKVKRDKVKKNRKWFQKYGSPVALLCWLPVIGDLIAVGLGFIRVKFIPVAVYMMIGKAFRYIVLGYIIISFK